MERNENLYMTALEATIVLSPVDISLYICRGRAHVLYCMGMASHLMSSLYTH